VTSHPPPTAFASSAPSLTSEAVVGAQSPRKNCLDAIATQQHLHHTHCHPLAPLQQRAHACPETKTGARDAPCIPIRPTMPREGTHDTAMPRRPP